MSRLNKFKLMGNLFRIVVVNTHVLYNKKKDLWMDYVIHIMVPVFIPLKNPETNDLFLGVRVTQHKFVLHLSSDHFLM